jgi:hypothetical protein
MGVVTKHFSPSPFPAVADAAADAMCASRRREGKPRDATARARNDTVRGEASDARTGARRRRAARPIPEGRIRDANIRKRDGTGDG